MMIYSIHGLNMMFVSVMEVLRSTPDGDLFSTFPGVPEYSSDACTAFQQRASLGV